MKIFELDNRDVESGYYDASQDEYHKRHLDDTRKPVLTLAALNRLKRMRALKKLEALKRQDLLAVMYAQPSAEGGGGPFGM